MVLLTIIIKYVIWKLIQQQAKFASSTGRKEKQIIFLPLVGGWVVGGIVDGAVDNNYKICYLETYTAAS